LLRFRTYLGEQYKQEDTITVEGKREERALPIVVIYMLGFKLPEIEAISTKVKRTYIDTMNDNEMTSKNSFIESLTHDAYFVQVPRINRDTYVDWENCSELKKMLSLFEQDYFVDENFLKTYPYPITDKNIKKMVETLEYIASDPKVRRAMQEEYWAAQNEILWENQVTTLTKKVAELQKILQRAGIDFPSS